MSLLAGAPLLVGSDSSQGGGAIFLHGWTHNLQIANNRVYNNSGTLSGGMVIGQGEFPEAYLAPTGFGPGATTAPGSCQNSGITNTQLPYCLQLNVNMHHNMVTYNSSTGDELFTGTPAGAGGVSICTGSDYYLFNYNWVCGNMSSGDGGGVGQLGFSYNGDIEHNTIIFNQSTNPTIPANGGGLLIMGAAPDGTTLVNGVATECGSVTDNDCVPGLSDGVGPGLVINANLLMGNGAEAGSGGGLRLQAVNGADIARFPANPERWYSVQVTNNIIVNNVAGWDGAGVSLEDSLVVNLINNTIASNDSTASSGTLFNTLGAPLASGQSPPSTITTNGTTTLPQPAGVVTMVNSPQLTSSFTTGAITCPHSHYQPGTSATNGSCTKVSYPMLQNNVLWQNRSFNIGVGSLSAQYQQNIVSLFNAFTGTPAPNQTSTGACPSGVSYWDVGVRGDTGPSNHASGFTLAPTYSVLTDSTDYPGLNNLGVNPSLVSQYCNGSRVPPENGGLGYQVPPGISDATAPNPLFSLTPNATVDEGNNWVNISWGPLSMSNPTTNVVLGNYTMQSSSPAIDYVPVGQPHPHTDFFGNPRPDPSNPTRFDVGAFEFQGAVATPTLTSISPTSGLRGTSVNVTLTGTNLSGTQSVNVSGAGVTVSNLADVNPTTVTATFTISNTAALTARNVTIRTSGGTTGSVTFTVTGPTLASINPTSGQRATGVPVTLSGTGLTGATAVNVAGGGITVSGLTVVNDSTVTATFTIGAGAALTGRTVTVTTPIGNTNGVAFTVVAPSFTLAPGSLAFGNQPDRSSSASQPVTLTNTGIGPLTITGISFTGTNPGVFTQASNCGTLPATLTVGGSCTINASFAPGLNGSSTAAGPKSANLSVAATGAAAQRVALTGTTTVGTAAFSAPVSALTTTPGNTTTKTGTITVSNTGTGVNAGPLTLTAAPTITRTAGSGAFSISGGSCISGTVINAGGNCTITVQYLPSGPTTSTAHVTITDSGATAASQNSGNFNGN